MHEMSIAQSLVEVAESAARQAGANEVQTVNLRLGALSGVVKEALLFSYDIVVENTLLQGSTLVIEELPVIVYCARCDAHSTLTDTYTLQCHHCHQPTATITQGKELDVVSLEYTP